MIKKNELKCLIFGLVSIFVGCGNPLGDQLSKVDSGYGPGYTEPTASPVQNGYEMISGSKLATTSLGASHNVDATIGASTSQIKLTTTRSKIIFLTVQGQIISK